MNPKLVRKETTAPNAINTHLRKVIELRNTSLSIIEIKEENKHVPLTTFSMGAKVA